MAEKLKTEDLIAEAKNFFNYYKKEIGKSIRKGSNIISVDFNDLNSFSPNIANYLLENPEDILRILELAVSELELVNNPRLRFITLPETIFSRIRNIRAKHLNKFIWIEGIIRQASEVRPQVVNAKFECPSCGTIISVLQVEKKFREPTRCSCGRKGHFKLISKEMVDAQRIVIEESPESLIGGEQPRRMNIFLKEDLVEPKMEEKTTPGSRVKIFGTLKEISISLQSGSLSTRFDLAIEANNIIPLTETYEELEISEEDERQIKELSVDSQLFEKMAQSIAPSIYGYDEIKQALVLQLFGGIRKKRSDGTFGRGDIHMLLVGDPGVAKSVLLKFISTIAPQGRYVVGKSATGAGLTATVVRDEFLKGWSLEAGAIVLSNKGILCIDELEKMDPTDRSAMHEALEQQTVTISKANVQASLRAETTVLAAANPKFGRFDPYQPIAQQIDITPTLLSRFDIIFMMKDLPDRAKDEAIATHVLLEHKESSSVYPIEPILFKKYIAYSRQNIIPELTDESIAEIKKFYVDLRNTGTTTESVVKPIPITARQLEALIRLSTAAAKVRLSNKIQKQDAKIAIDLMKFYLMQAGYDYEAKTFDIDKIVTGVSTSKRSQIIIVRECISRLESRLGKLIPIEEIKKELEGKLNESAVDDALDKLTISGDVFHPRKNYVQRM